MHFRLPFICEIIVEVLFPVTDIPGTEMVQESWLFRFPSPKTLESLRNLLQPGSSQGVFLDLWEILVKITIENPPV